MKDNLIDLDDFEKVMKKKFDNKRIDVPESLDKRIFSFFEEILDTHHYRPILHEGFFSLMVAADDDETVAVELFDDEMKTKIKIFEAHDGVSPYLVEIYPLEGYEDLLEKYIGSRIVIKADGKEVLFSEITDSEFSDFIPRNRVARKKHSWSYHILPDSPDE